MAELKSDRERIATLEATVNMNMPRIEKCFAELAQNIKDAKVDILQFIEKSRVDFLERHKNEIKNQEDKINRLSNENAKYWSDVNDKFKAIDKRHRMHDKAIAILAVIVVFFFGWASLHPSSAAVVAGVARSVVVKPQ